MPPFYNGATRHCMTRLLGQRGLRSATQPEEAAERDGGEADQGEPEAEPQAIGGAAAGGYKRRTVGQAVDVEPVGEQLGDADQSDEEDEQPSGASADRLAQGASAAQQHGERAA